MECKNCGKSNNPEARFCAYCGKELVTTAEPAQVPVPPAQAVPVVTVEYVGFGMRLGAALVDFLIIQVAVFFVSVALRIGIGYAALGPIFSILLYWLYGWLLIGLKGQTVGKMAIGIKVVDQQGNIPGLGRAALREIAGKIVSAIAIFIGFFWILKDEKKQGWHDKIAGTYVVKAERGK